MIICVYFKLFIQSEYYNVYISIYRQGPLQRNLLKLLIIKLHNDIAYEYKLLTYKIRKNYGSDIRVNLGHQIIKFIIKEKKETLRIIVSSVESPLHNLSSFLHKIINKSLLLANSSTVNSYFLT